ncbi:hypothetical protein Avbf_05387 [Armadillidium vulgare]|nr:hypothetical protein Avbf_05387 [Armadillidium vulgare]
MVETGIFDFKQSEFLIFFNIQYGTNFFSKTTETNASELKYKKKIKPKFFVVISRVREGRFDSLKNVNIVMVLSVKVSSESSTKSPDLSKSNTSEMKRQIAATTVGVKSKHAVITTMKNESSQLNKAVKFTNDSNKIIEEKQTQIQNILTFPGHSFILVLSEKIEEDTKAYNCELVNLKDADLGSQKGTSDEIAAVLKGRTSDLDKDGVSFATLSTFLSIQKKIYKRIILELTKEAGMKDPKVTTCGVNSLEKGKPQIVKFAQYPGDPSQGQKQTLKRLHPGSKTLSKTAVNITVAEFESDKFSETKEGKRKIEKIVWDKDKINTSKSDSDKSSETKNGKRKIEKIVWDKNKITASKSESDTSSEMGKRKRKIVEVDWDEDKITAATSEAEKSFETKKNKKIVLNEENFMDEDSDDDGILDLEK